MSYCYYSVRLEDEDNDVGCEVVCDTLTQVVEEVKKSRMKLVSVERIETYTDYIKSLMKGT